MKMKKRLIWWLPCVTLVLSVFYLMTARVYLEGSLGESYTMLKPFPSIETDIGGGEDGAWARAHPGQPTPWWQKEDSVKLLWCGDWEMPKFWPLIYSYGAFLPPVLWLAFAIVLLKHLIRKPLSLNPAP